MLSRTSSAWEAGVLVAAVLLSATIPQVMAGSKQSSRAPSPWGPGCNDSLLEGPFALVRAPDFEVPPDDLKRIEEVIGEVRRGYGGTLVTSPPDKVLDSSAFLSAYLRAFAKLDGKGLATYDYRFERILARLSGAEAVLEDARLDWDVWRAFLVYENRVAAHGDVNEYRSGLIFIKSLDSAKDLLWGYLAHNTKEIRGDNRRLHWWFDAITEGVKAPGGRPLRRWFLLQLLSSSDTETSKLATQVQPDPGDAIFPVTKSSPYNPFLEVDSRDDPFFEEFFRKDGFLKALQNGKSSDGLPPFSESIERIASSQNLDYEVWGIDPSKMPPTTAWQADLAPRPSQATLSVVLDQESWSKRRQDYFVRFSRPIGRRSTSFNVRLPGHDSKDGVFFFTFNAVLYVWPKARMDDAIAQILYHSKTIGEKTYNKLLDAGYERLEGTLKSP